MKTALYTLSQNRAPYILPDALPRPLLCQDVKAIPHWSTLELSPASLFHLRCWLSAHPEVPHLFSTKERSFHLADIALLIAGKHADGKHSVPKGTLHDSLKDLHQQTRNLNGGREERKALFEDLQSLMFDAATMLDHLSGSNTMIIRAPGTTIPGTPNRPEYLKAHVYLPPAFLAANPDLHRVLMDIIQQFIETVGIRTVDSWLTGARNSLGYGLRYTGPQTARPNPESLSIPPPYYRDSSYYVFLGQESKMGEIPTSVSDTTCDLGTLSQESFADTENYDQHWHEVVGLTEDSALLKHRVAALEERNSVLEASNAELLVELEEARETIQILRNTKALQNRLTANTPRVHFGASPVPTTPVRSATPVRSQSTTPFRSGGSFVPAQVTTPSRTPAIVNGSHLHLPVTPTRSHKPSTPVSRQKSGFDATVPSVGVPFISPDDLSDAKTASEVMLTQVLDHNNYTHLAQSIDFVFARWPGEGKVSALCSLGIQEDIANTIVSIKSI